LERERRSFEERKKGREMRMREKRKPSRRKLKEKSHDIKNHPPKKNLIISLSLIPNS